MILSTVTEVFPLTVKVANSEHVLQFTSKYEFGSYKDNLTTLLIGMFRE